MATDSITPLSRSAILAYRSGPDVTPTAPLVAPEQVTTPRPAWRRYASVEPREGPDRVTLPRPEPPLGDLPTDFAVLGIMPTLVKVVETASPPLVGERFDAAVLASLNGIARLDPTLAVERHRDRIRIFKGDHELASFTMPRNILQWAATAEGTALEFRRVSTAAHGASDREVNDAFYRGLTQPLRPFASHRASDESRPVMEVAANGVIEAKIVDGIGVLTIANLSHMSVLEVQKVLTYWGLLGDGELCVKGVVIDLTDAIGDDINAATLLANSFLRRGLIYRSRANDPENDQRREADGAGIPDDVPVVVLTNGATRGSPEIAAQALQEHHRAVVYGTSTFGDAMEWDQIFIPSGGQISLTKADIVGPSGVTSQGQGVTPQACAVDRGIAITPQARTQARRQGQHSESPTLPLRLFCPPSPSRAVVTGSSFQPFDETEREAWTGNAILLLQNPVRYRAMLERVERAPQPKPKL